jgi:hypothetical protein
MFSEDYIIRMISQAVAVLAKIAGLRQAKQYPQAQQSIDQALEHLLGLRADLLKQLDDAVIFRMLTIQDRVDGERLVVMADLFRAEGDILSDQQHPAESQQSYQRALNFYLEASLSDQIQPQPAKVAQEITWLVNQPGILPLTDDLLWSLFNYYEGAGLYQKAEAALTELASRPGLNADLRPELLDFYRHLITLSPDELARNHLDRRQIQEKLEKI